MSPHLIPSPRIPLFTLLGLGAGLSVIPQGPPAVITALIMTALVGLPLDSMRRSEKVAVAVGWILFPLVMMFMGDCAVETVQNRDSLFFIACFPHIHPSWGMGLGYLGGLFLCAAVEWVEARTSERPSLRPMQALGLLFGTWIVLIKLTPDSEPIKQGLFFQPALALTVIWVAVRLVRSTLRQNAARRAIEEQRKAERGPFSKA